MSKPDVRPPGGLYAVLALAGMVLAGRAEAGSILRIGPCVNPHCSVGVHYLVRGSNACGAGSYGASTSLVERVSTACP